jgi:restriction system protein
MTIREAILKVFEHEGKPLTPESIYDKILEEDLYQFNTDSPIHVVKTRLRRECEGLEFATSSKHKYFQLLSDGTYWLLDKPIPTNKFKAKATTPHSELNTRLKQAYSDYIQSFKANLLDYLKNLDPYKFEEFCGELLTKYGFNNVEVTSKSRDGGIDGYGQLKLGFTHLEVAFQCKRFNKNNIQPKDIREFRGSIREKCIYGIFFTTAGFSNTAIQEAERKDLKSVVLIDGLTLVDFMIKERFGVDIIEELPVFVSELDNII